jgi:Mg2+/citrate symporter
MGRPCGRVCSLISLTNTEFFKFFKIFQISSVLFVLLFTCKFGLVAIRRSLSQQADNPEGNAGSGHKLAPSKHFAACAMGLTV